MTGLTAAWIPRHKRIDHPERRRMRRSKARTKFAAAARRSGKTEDGADYTLVGHGPEDSNGQPYFRGALNPPPNVMDPTYVVAAPTREMVKRLWWGRIKDRLTDRWTERVSETDLTVHLRNGARIICMGMDRPTRGEGIAIDGLVGDEYAYWKEGAFERSLRPALSTRGRPPGWAILMGKPSGRNHFFDSWTEAREGRMKDAEAFHWTTSVIASPAEIEAARASMDPRSFQQEYEASFLTQAGLVFYQWDSQAHCRPLQYDPSLPLVFCFDFNVSPGAAVVCQEQFVTDANGKQVQTTCVIREYYLRDDNNAPLMCQKLADFYPEHKQPVHVYGDTGGHQRRTSAKSTDWEIVRDELGKRFASVEIRVARNAPSVVDSVNAVNARLRTSSGAVRLLLDPEAAQHTRRDFEGVVWDEKKGDRQIDKRDKRRTHWVDALRYYIAEAHPIGGGPMVIY